MNERVGDRTNRIAVMEKSTEREQRSLAPGCAAAEVNGEQIESFCALELVSVGVVVVNWNLWQSER